MYKLTIFFNILSYLVNILDFSNESNVVQFSITISILLILGLSVCIAIRRLVVNLYNCLFFSLIVLSYIFEHNILLSVSVTFLLFGNTIFLFTNTSLIRKYVAKKLVNEKIRQNKKISKVDIDKFIEDMSTTVRWLSDNKVGALITIERKISLDDYIKSGTNLDSAFTPELVESIFYEGTRLHDGALIIRDNKIIAGGVFFPPSNSTFIGKFGARHRAAMGISEITDSITIIVSEETGRVAIAHSGIMDNIRINEFKNVFKNQFNEK